MAVHNFNYTYAYVSVKTMAKSIDDDTQIVREVCIAVTAVDQADNTKTLTENMHSPLLGVFTLKDNTLPDNFILVDNLTDNQVIDWYKTTITDDELDIYFTWQIYGAAEVSPLVE
jgi:hypothetical protein|tara:strand:- start:29 stop:373 length:345 start_codon:yes stop_codon:yes gene_type:complete